MSQQSGNAVDRALTLAADFWFPPDAVGRLRAVPVAVVPQPFRDLLDHRSHMTVAMERRHGAPLGVRVLAVKHDGPTGYAREILLLGPAGGVVQYGIVRIDLAAVDDQTAAAIQAGTTPLGRLLIDAGILRDVHDVHLLEVVPGSRLSSLLAGDTAGTVALDRTFGRVARIDLDGRPAIELLEIAAPLAAE